MKKIYSLIAFLAFLMVCGTTNVMAEDNVLLKSVDFTNTTLFPATSYSPTSADTYYDLAEGVTLYAKKGKTIAINNPDAGVNFGGQNMDSNGKQGLAIPVTGVNGSITVVVKNDYNNTSATYKIGIATADANNPQAKQTWVMGPTNSGSVKKEANQFTLTKTGLTGEDFIIWVGEQGSAYPIVKEVSIYTEAPTRTETGRTTTITDVKVNDESIGAELTTLLADKSITLSTPYRFAPSVKFEVTTTVSYDDGTTSELVNNVTADVAKVEVEGTEVFQATATVNETVYTITMPVAEPVSAIVPVSTATTWNWTGATEGDIQLAGDEKDHDVFFANYGPWATGFNYEALMGNGQYLSRPQYKCFQGNYVIFDAAVSGTVTITYSNTGSNAARGLKVNGVAAGETSTGGSGDQIKTTTVVVNPGEVKLEGYLASDDTPAYIRILKVVFTPCQVANISAGGLTTFCAISGNVAIPEGVTAYTVDVVVEGESAVLTEVEGSVLPQGVGVVLEGEAGKNFAFVASDEAAATISADNKMVGVTADSAIPSNCYVLGVKDGACVFGKWNGTTFPAGKAYLNYSNPSGAPLRIVKGDATGIESVIADQQSESMYNVHGQKVDASYKGVVIMKGQKMIRK